MDFKFSVERIKMPINEVYIEKEEEEVRTRHDHKMTQNKHTQLTKKGKNFLIFRIFRGLMMVMRPINASECSIPIVVFFVHSRFDVACN